MRQIGVRDEAKMFGGYGTLRPSAVLHDVPAVVRAGLDQDGQAAGPEPQSVEAVGPVRPAEVLPALRAAEREGRRARRLRRAKAAATTRPAAARAAGTGGCGSCGHVARSASVRQSAIQNRQSKSDSNETAAIAITRYGDPAGIGPEIAATAAADPRVLGRLRAGVVRAPIAATFDTGCVERGRGPRRIRRHRPRGWRRAARRRAGDRDRSGQQGSVPARRPAVERSHRSARAPDRIASHVAMMFYSDALRVVLATVHVPLADVPRALTHGVARGDDRADGARAAAIRRSAAAHRRRRAESARRRTRPVRPRGGSARSRRRSSACRDARHRRLRPVSGRHGVRPRPPRRVRRRHRLLSRSGADSGEAGGVRPGRERHARACRSSGRRSITARRSTSPARASPTRRA